MFSKSSNFVLSLLFTLVLTAQTYAAADVASNSDAWARNNVDHTDIGTNGINIDTSFALASDNDKIEVAIMIRNTGNTTSGTIELLRTGDLEEVYINNTFKKYQSGSWTNLTSTDWTNLNTVGTKLDLGIVASNSYIRLVYQIDIGNGHSFGDILQDYIYIYENSSLVKTLSVSTYVPYVKIQSANSRDDNIVLVSAVDLLESTAETITNFEVSQDGGSSFTTLETPSTAVYLSSGTGRTITLDQSQIDFDSGDDIVVRLSNVKTADDLRFLSSTNFTTADSSVSTATFTAVDTTSPTYTAGLDSVPASQGILFLSFDEPMDTSTLTTSNVLTRTSFSNGHDLGTAPTVSWTSTSEVEIELDSNGDITTGDTVTLTSNVTDSNGNPVDTSAVIISAIILNAPTIDSFVIADQTSANSFYTNDRIIDVTSFIASDSDGVVSGYLINESSTTPALSEIDNTTAPNTYSIIGSEGSRTIYAWVKDDDDHITGTSTGITLDLTDPVVTTNVASGTYNSARTVMFSFATETNPDSIYYTLDGSTPDKTDNLYTTNLSINSDVTLKFIGYDLANNSSSVVSRTYNFVCSPSSVNNGSVSAYPSCVISCDNGYYVSGNSCVKKSSGGGGGGGSFSVDTTTIYALPSLSSDSSLKLYRPLKIPENQFTRPVKHVNYYTDARVEIELGTEIFDLDGKILTGSVIYPINRIKAEEAKTNLRIPYPSKELVYSSYYQYGSLEEIFSSEIEISIPLTSSMKKLDPKEFEIYQWLPSTDKPTVSSGGIVYRSGEWFKMGDGSIVNEDGVLEFITESSFLIAFTSSTAISNSEEINKTEISEEKEEITSFTDILGHWAKTYIEQLYEKGVVSGKTATTFVPNDNLTRAELTKIALKSFDFEIPKIVEVKPFSDVALNTWYAVYVAKAKNAGVLSGYADGTFRPNQPVNRVEALKILIEAAKIDTTDFEASFLDTNPDAWYASYLAYAKQKGIVEGYAIATSVPVILSGSVFTTVNQVYGFDRYLGEGDEGDDVEKLQKVLILLGFLESEITGIFDQKTKKALIAYQLDREIITNAESLGSGYFGPLTFENIITEKIQNKVEFKQETKYKFKPEQFITRAEIAKIAVKLIENQE